jgi:hypothetical protein
MAASGSSDNPLKFTLRTFSIRRFAFLQEKQI